MAIRSPKSTPNNATGSILGILLTLYSLTNKTSNDEVLEMLKQGQIPNTFNRRGRKIIESMITPETFTGEYAIQYIKNAKSYRKSMKV